MSDELILQLCTSNPMGLSGAQLQKEVPHLSLEEVGAIINKLVAKRQLEGFVSHGEVVFRFIRPEQTAKLQNLSFQESMVFEIIKQAGANGVWTRDLKSKTSLQSVQLARILKSLETKNTVKPFTSVQKKKVYLLYELEPSKSISGGPWYTNGEPDTSFITTLYELTLKFFNQQTVATTADVHLHIRRSGISTVELSRDEVQQLVNTLIYDNMIEICPLHEMTQRRTEIAYRIARPQGVVPNNYTEIPCATCPKFLECGDDSIVNPRSCVYMQQWLEKCF